MEPAVICGRITWSALLLLNFSLIFLGFSIVTFNSTVQTELDKYTALFDPSPLAINKTFGSILGLVLFASILIGFVGTCKENANIMFLYSICLALLCIGSFFPQRFPIVNAEIIAAKGLRESLQEYSLPDERGDSVRESWNVIQRSLACCGVLDYTDWKNVTFLSSSNEPGIGTYVVPTPTSCCIIDEPDCSANVFTNIADDPKYIFVDGCLKKTVEYMKEVTTLKTTAIQVVAFVGVLLALLFALQIRRRKSATTHPLGKWLGW